MVGCKTRIRIKQEFAQNKNSHETSIRTEQEFAQNKENRIEMLGTLSVIIFILMLIIAVSLLTKGSNITEIVSLIVKFKIKVPYMSVFLYSMLQENSKLQSLIVM